MFYLKNCTIILIYTGPSQTLLFLDVEFLDSNDSTAHVDSIEEDLGNQVHLFQPKITNILLKKFLSE